VIPDNFTYQAPASLAEAFAMLGAHPGEAKLLAGGQSLIPLMKLRLAGPGYLVDLGKVPGLDTLAERDGMLVIGAMVREHALEHSPLVQKRYTGLYEASSVVADPLVRNFATLGGNLAHADPANDHPAMMLALRAVVVAQSPSGTREIPIDDFLVDTFETALKPDEILTEIRIPQPRPNTGSAYVKLERKVGDYAIAAVAASVTLDGGICAEVGIGLTNVGPKAIRATAAERYLTGQSPSEAAIAQAAKLAADAAQPTADLRGPVEYKRAMVQTMAARALHAAVKRAQGG
jgi:aerobic carbon-monoxide dehydrogenase medium subunit